MSAEPLSVFSSNTSRPPYQITSSKMLAPINSDKGELASFLRSTFVAVACVAALVFSNDRVRMVSARNACTTRKPLKVSSSNARARPSSACALVLDRLRLFPTVWIKKNDKGSTKSRNRVRRGLMLNRMAREPRMSSGSRTTNSKVLSMDHSISFMSVLARESMSPLRLWV